jgi:hypothetical protein
MAQRVVQYQAVLQMAQMAPQIYDLPHLHRQMIEIIGIKNADKIIPVEEDQKPRDPVSENMAALVGKPMKAFIYQDHDAHITTHQSFMQDPMIAQTIGQNPQGQPIMAALMAHIAEHLAFSYRKKIEEQLGAPLPEPDQELPEQIEVELSRLVADAGKQLTQINQQQAAQQQAQQQQQDPMFQLQQAEIQIKQSEVQRKQQKDQADNQLGQAKLQLEQARIAAQSQSEAQRIAAQRQQANDKIKADMIKQLTDQQHQMRQQPKGGQ